MNRGFSCWAQDVGVTNGRLGTPSGVDPGFWSGSKQFWPQGAWAPNLLKIGGFRIEIAWKLHDFGKILGARGAPGSTSACVLTRLHSHMSSHLASAAWKQFWIYTCSDWSPYSVETHKERQLYICCKALFTQDAEHLATGVSKLWDTLWSMRVFTQVASNIKGFARKFACKSAYASCVNRA